jgi:hypothetical protein
LEPTSIGVVRAAFFIIAVNHRVLNLRPCSGLTAVGTNTCLGEDPLHHQMPDQHPLPAQTLQTPACSPKARRLHVGESFSKVLPAGPGRGARTGRGPGGLGISGAGDQGALFQPRAGLIGRDAAELCAIQSPIVASIGCRPPIQARGIPNDHHSLRLHERPCPPAREAVWRA